MPSGRYHQIMWPKVFAQLVELLPHVTRLLPVADRIAASRRASQTAGERANETVMAAMADGVRDDLGQVTAAQTGLYRQLQEHSLQLAEVVAEAKITRLAIEAYAHRTTLLQGQIAAIGLWVKAGVVLLVAVLAIVIALLLRSH